MIVSKVDSVAQLVEAELDLGHADYFRLCEISYTKSNQADGVSVYIGSLWDLVSEVELCPLPQLRYEIEKHIEYMYDSGKVWDNWGWPGEA